ncbi:hypothetical protein T484DRAFT_1853559 [Baffinella frigidus]|nr:hypothetical protein T484DRAFT_1853559 [Cryptophyta sp. CCMP2293]
MQKQAMEQEALLAAAALAALHPSTPALAALHPSTPGATLAHGHGHGHGGSHAAGPASGGKDSAGPSHKKHKTAIALALAAANDASMIEMPFERLGGEEAQGRECAGCCE